MYTLSFCRRLNILASYMLLLALWLCANCTNRQQSKNNYPDESTWFPLLPGSFWVYELEMYHEPQPAQQESLYVVALSQENGNYIVEVSSKWIDEESPDTRYYRVEKNGQVFMNLRRGENWYEVASLYPKFGDSLPFFADTTKWQYFSSTCEEHDSSCLRAENFSFEKAPEGANLDDWHGILFKRGVGKTYDGGPETGWCLRRYRIGENGPVVNYGETNDQ